MPIFEPTFDGKTKVGRRVADPKTDKVRSAPGALIFAAMTTPAGLAGCTGIDDKLIHGDRWQQIDGNFTEQVNANEMTTILGNQTRTVIGNRNLTTVGNVNSTTVSNLNQTVVGSTIRTYVGAAAYNYVSNHVATHASPQNRFEPGVYLHFVMSTLGRQQSAQYRDDLFSVLCTLYDDHAYLSQSHPSAELRCN